MISSVAKLQPIEGLTKREQSKLERLMRSDEIHKTQNDAKNYKRKAPKTKLAEEPQPRKITKTDQRKFEDPALSGTSTPHHEESKKQSASSVQQSKKELKVLKPFNSSLPIEGGEQGLFNYIIGYVCTQKQKLLEAQYQDTTFLDEMDGKQLEIVNKKQELSNQPQHLNQFCQQKNKIKHLFDECHRSLMKKISHIDKNDDLS